MQVVWPAFTHHHPALSPCTKQNLLTANQRVWHSTNQCVVQPGPGSYRKSCKGTQPRCWGSKILLEHTTLMTQEERGRQIQKLTLSESEEVVVMEFVSTNVLWKQVMLCHLKSTLTASGIGLIKKKIIVFQGVQKTQDFHLAQNDELREKILHQQPCTHREQQVEKPDYSFERNSRSRKSAFLSSVLQPAQRTKLFPKHPSSNLC